MPHIVFKSNPIVKTPFKSNNMEFLFVAQSFSKESDRKTEYKVAVKYQNRDFMLAIKEKDDNFLIKSDKTTRISPVAIIKDAINSYAKENGTDILFTNTSNLKEKKEIPHKYLKDIEYFVDDFKTDKNIQIEIGFGSGRHLLYQAKNNPNVQFIGLEIHYPSIEQLLKQLELQNITNVLVVNYDARLFMEFIESNQVEKIFVHFPVPWDKKPHRRIYSKEFVNEALRVLKIDGKLELRTDSRNYFDFCVDLLTNLNQASILIDVNKELKVVSKYEDRWRRQGKNIYDVVLISKAEDKKRDLNFDFSFDFDFDLNRFFEQSSLKALIMGNYFVHIEELYKILDKENSGLIKVTMGNFDRPITKYILVLNGKLSYYQGEPLPTSSNIISHKKLKEVLQK